MAVLRMMVYELQHLDYRMRVKGICFLLSCLHLTLILSSSLYPSLFSPLAEEGQEKRFRWARYAAICPVSYLPLLS